jgi:hypothetical protein
VAKNLAASYGCPRGRKLAEKGGEKNENLNGNIFYTILKMKANEMHYFSNLFDKVLYMFRISPLSIIRSI